VIHLRVAVIDQEQGRDAADGFSHTIPVAVVFDSHPSQQILPVSVKYYITRNCLLRTVYDPFEDWFEGNFVGMAPTSTVSKNRKILLGLIYPHAVTNSNFYQFRTDYFIYIFWIHVN
jgi:hypothetical protein